MRRTVLNLFILCLLASLLIVRGPFEPAGTGERLAIICVWIAGLCASGWRFQAQLMRRHRAGMERSGD